MAIKPITGMLRRGLIMDISIGLGIGFAMGNLFWYGYHMPRTNARDNHYRKLEAERAAARAQ
ncbi:Cytochrome c oxidase, subunit VIIa, fungal [Niveomyces insectorum RCEF 264]|uniref:Cytochrome c oxidase subunit 9, mitochondrial n=1 Tax=Niveomyces insectorum RCEF 264 TaxID=1081102 RepID=A0A167UV67_9HYPO|nr:Cytochrome c oxidase, subunit VIIa, fungal [Niveomyces insectorum RCEF 264]